MIRVGLVALASLLLAAPAFAARHAVVIGNAAYAVAPLANATRDADLLARRLTAIGFTVTTHFDITSADIPDLRAELVTLQGAEIGVVYFVGHAVQIEGQSHILPVDLDALDMTEIDRKKIPLSDLITAVSGGTAGLRLFLIDACRTDPFSGLSERIEVGLDTRTGIRAPQSTSAETLIAYSTGSGQLASDGPIGGHGPFAIALERSLREPGLELSEITRRVARQVSNATEETQIPTIWGTLRNRYWLNDADVFRPPQTDAPPSSDEILWDVLATSADPVALQRFARFFPDSPFAESAIERLATLPRRRRAPTAPAVPPEAASAAQSAPLPAPLLDINRSSLPEIEGGFLRNATECDWLAADFTDLQRVTPGVRAGLVEIEAATQACVYELMAEPDATRAKYQLGRVLEIAGRSIWARHFYWQAAQDRYASAFLALGHMYMEANGVDEDFNQAHLYYRVAAEFGNLRARTNIGEQFLRGWGVEKDPVEALAWYRFASRVGWAPAQNALADRYRRGDGTVQDYQAAAALYRLAALNGQRAAMTNFGRLLIRGEGVTQDRAEGRLWLARGVDAGDRFAPYHLARDLVTTGEASGERLIELLTLSARRGNPRASLELARHYWTGEVLDRDPEAAFREAYRAELARTERAAELTEEIAATLPTARVAELSEEVAQSWRLNGR